VGSERVSTHGAVRRPQRSTLNAQRPTLNSLSRRSFTRRRINFSFHVIGLVNASVDRATIQNGCSGKEEEKARMLKTRADPAADALP